MFTDTKDHVLPSTTIGSWPRPSWFDMSMWGTPLSSCMLDLRYREKFQDAMSTIINDQERAGLDIVTHGDLHCDEDLAGRSWHHYPLQRWKGLEGDHIQPQETRSSLLQYPPGTLLYEIYSGWRWPHVVDKIEPADLEYDKIWRIAQAKAHRPVRFGTCSAQVMGLFLDIYTDKYKDNREVIWDMAVAMNEELKKLRDAGCTSVQVEEPTLHFMADKFPDDKDTIKFMVKALNREIEGLEDIEVWLHTCWGNPAMQRVMDDNSYRNAVELYLEEVKGDVWTIEACDSCTGDLPMFEPFKDDLKKKIAVGTVSHRSLQADRPNDVAERIRHAMQYIPPENLIASSDCGFGRQGSHRDIAMFKASAIAQGADIVRQELGYQPKYIAAADPKLQTDIIPEKGA